MDRSNNVFMLMLWMVAMFFVACETAPEKGQDEKKKEKPSGLIQVQAVGMEFEAPDTVPSGWLSFSLQNTSDMIHFAMIERLPQGKTVEDQQEEIAPVFQNILDNINEKEPSVPEAGFEPPEWFNEIVFLGGPGLVSAGKTAEATVYLEPGTYMLECYIKTNGIFHSYNPGKMAMVHGFTVTSDTSDLEEPVPDVRIELSTENGIVVDGEIATGKQIIKVTFKDQKVHENFVQHDVHLVSLTDTTDMDALEDWMDWTQPNGVQTPAPAEFLGGTNEMRAGEETYISVDLSPGNYAWISEVPNAKEKGMFKTFTVE